jgi:hypothetical protein
LTLTNGANDPEGGTIPAGVTAVRVGEFTFNALNSSYTGRDLPILIPGNATSSVRDISVSYTDLNGQIQTSVTQVPVWNGIDQYASTTFQGVDFYAPLNDSTNVEVYIATASVAQGAVPGTAIQVLVGGGNQYGLFEAIDSSGAVTNEINGGTNLAAQGTFYITQ